MMSNHLFISKGGVSDLASCATILLTCLGVEEIHRRESSNYVSGEYFVASFFGAKIVVAGCDEEDFPQHDYWIAIGGDGVGGAQVQSLGGFVELMARLLALSGFSVARPLQFGQLGGEYLIYKTLEDNKNQVVVKRAI